MFKKDIKTYIINLSKEISAHKKHKKNLSKEGKSTSDCYQELKLKKFMVRHLFIVYGLARGRTREQIEPKFNLNPHHNYNPVTKKYIQGSDPIDWDYIESLKTEYLLEDVKMN